MACKAMLLGGLALLLGPALRAGAEPQADQAFLPPGEFAQDLSDLQDLAQTFTPGVSGLITAVEVHVYRDPLRTTGSVDVSIREAPLGTPTSTVLGTVSVPATTFPDSVGGDVVSIDFSAAGVVLTQGTTYAIVAHTDAPWLSDAYHWSGANDTAYAGGGAFNGSGDSWSSSGAYDRLFRTTMESDALAIARVELAGSGETLEGFAADTQDTKVSKKLLGAAAAAGKARDLLAPEAPQRSKAIAALKKAIAGVRAAVAKGLPAEDGDEVLDDLVATARGIAQDALEEAIGAGADEADLASALAAFDAGEAALSEEGDHAAAIKAYAKAAKLAEKRF